MFGFQSFGFIRDLQASCRVRLGPLPGGNGSQSFTDLDFASGVRNLQGMTFLRLPSSATQSGGSAGRQEQYSHSGKSLLFTQLFCLGKGLDRRGCVLSKTKGPAGRPS